MYTLIETKKLKADINTLLVISNNITPDIAYTTEPLYFNSDISLLLSIKVIKIVFYDINRKNRIILI
jgi:hypothetical protein